MYNVNFSFPASDLLVNIVGTILGGLILTFILFLLNEHVFTKPNLTGEWKTIIAVSKTDYKPFLNLAIEYKIHLLQKGNEIIGSGEKVRDIDSTGKETKFLRQNRVVITIEGYFERKFLSKSKIYLNINEEGRQRETRATYFLEFHKNTINGRFISTAGDSEGTVTMNLLL